jgi:hypothetical protein
MSQKQARIIRQKHGRVGNLRLVCHFLRHCERELIIFKARGDSLRLEKYQREPRSTTGYLIIARNRAKLMFEKTKFGDMT